MLPQFTLRGMMRLIFAFSAFAAFFVWFFRPDDQELSLADDIVVQINGDSFWEIGRSVQVSLWQSGVQIIPSTSVATLYGDDKSLSSRKCSGAVAADVVVIYEDFRGKRRLFAVCDLANRQCYPGDSPKSDRLLRSSKHFRDGWRAALSSDPSG